MTNDEIWDAIINASARIEEIDVLMKNENITLPQYNALYKERKELLSKRRRLLIIAQ